MKPLLAHIYEPHRVTYPCYVQPKLNGIRALYQNGSFQSRDELPFPVGLLDHLAKPLLDTFDPSVILDGELYVHGWPLQRINAAVTPIRQSPTEDTTKVEYHVFDVVDFNERFYKRQLLRQRIPPIYCVETFVVDDEAHANRYYAQFVDAGYEGMMYRVGNCPYTTPQQLQWQGKSPTGHARFWADQANRCWHLLKRKDWQDDEFECIEVQEGEGKLKGTLGALRCVIKKIPTRFGDITGLSPLFPGNQFSVGSGLTDAERAHYWANPPIGKLIKVKYLVLSNDGIPLNPTVIAVL